MSFLYFSAILGHFMQEWKNNVTPGGNFTMEASHLEESIRHLLASPEYHQKRLSRAESNEGDPG